MSGPQFLLLYSVLALLANFGLRGYFRRNEARASTPVMDFAQDPYQIALLRGGSREAVAVAMVNLVDRGLLVESDGRVNASRSDAGQRVRRPLEQAILARAGNWVAPEELLEAPAVIAACREYEGQLGARRLLADARVRAERYTAFVIVLTVMLGIAGARIANAVMHGRHNILFLIILSAICGIALFAAYRRRLTGLGDETLHKMRTLFGRLKERNAGIAAGGASTDAVLVAAVFGLSALPANAFPYAQRLNPKPKNNGDGGGDSGSSSSDSGGCGGGGCGGGCGG